MNPEPEYSTDVAEKILEAEAKLAKLDKAIEEIGHPANDELRRRLNALRVEENALKRNFVESMRRGEPDSVRIAKMDTLLKHIQREQDSVGHEADFLQQAAPSSMTAAVEGSVKAMEFVRDGVKKIMGNHHPLGESPLVNKSHESLEQEFGLEKEERRPAAGS